jgi:hypothetical protein
MSAPEPDPVVAALLRVQAGRLDESQLARLRERAERLRREAAVLARWHLENEDEPAPSFHAIGDGELV